MKTIFVSSTPKFTTVTHCRCGARLPATIVTDADIHCHTCIEKKP